jgi:hypothetical protein
MLLEVGIPVLYWRRMGEVDTLIQAWC